MSIAYQRDLSTHVSVYHYSCAQEQPWEHWDQDSEDKIWPKQIIYTVGSDVALLEQAEVVTSTFSFNQIQSYPLFVKTDLKEILN